MAGKEVLLRLAREHDVLLESFRPGVLDRLGVGYERLREVNPGLVYCAITGYGQDGPYTARSGHDMNYLGLNGLLALTGEQRRPARPGRRPDRRPRRRRADRGLRDPRRAARARPLGGGPGRRRLDVRRRDVLAGHGRRAGAVRGARPSGAASSSSRARSSATGPTAAPTAGSPWARSSRSSGPPAAAASGREDLVEQQFEPLGSERRPPGGRGHLRRPHARASGTPSPTEHDCCLEPVLELDEALDSELVAGPGHGRRARPARAPSSPCACSASRSSSPGPRPTRTPGPARASASTPREVLAEAGYAARRDRAPRGRRRRRRTSRRRAGQLPGRMNADGHAEDGRAGRALRRLGGHDQALPARGPARPRRRVVRTSRNMAWYPPEFVDRIRLIKRLQEERFMPLRAIRDVIEEDPERPRRWSRSRTASSSGPSPPQEGARVSARRGPGSATTSRRTCSTGSRRSAS